VNRRHLLDASALLALIFDEPGADTVREIIEDCRMHAVHLAEVLRKLVALGMPLDEVIARIADLHLDLVEELNAGHVNAIARMTPESKRLGLSLGDCVCLVIAESLDLRAVTADRRWSEVRDRNLEILQIR